MSNVISIDEYLTIKTIINRDFGSKKFIFTILTDDNESVITYISDDLNDFEVINLIQSLTDHRNSKQ